MSQAIDLQKELDALEARAKPLLESDEDRDSLLVMRLREELTTGIEELRVAEEQLRTSKTEATEAINAGTQAILQLAGLPYFESDTHGVITRVNEEFADMMGRQAKYLIGKPIPTLLAIESRNLLRESVTRLVHADFDACELMFERRDGEQVHRSATAGRVIQGDRNIIRWVLRDSSHDDAKSAVVDALTEQLEALYTATSLSTSLVESDSSIKVIVDKLAALVQEVTHADAVTVDLVRGRKSVEQGVCGHEALIKFSAAQFEKKNGPSWDAVNDNEIVVTDAVQVDPRWGQVHEDAINFHAQAVQAIPLSISEQALGVITAYRSSAQPFDEDDANNLKLIAFHAAPVVSNKQAYEALQREAENLAVAIASRGVIEQAKGMIMCVEKCSEEEAFERLKELSQHSNVKLRDLALSVVDRMSKSKD